mgnify:CR=1 FL=1
MNSWIPARAHFTGLGRDDELRQTSSPATLPQNNTVKGGPNRKISITQYLDSVAPLCCVSSMVFALGECRPRATYPSHPGNQVRLRRTGGFIPLLLPEMPLELHSPQLSTRMPPSTPFPPQADSRILPFNQERQKESCLSCKSCQPLLAGQFHIALPVYQILTRAPTFRGRDAGTGPAFAGTGRHGGGLVSTKLST